MTNPKNFLLSLQCLILLAGGFIPFNAIAKTLDEGTLIKVRVYTDRAEAVRRYTADFEAGSYTIHLKNLPATLMVESIRLSQIEGAEAQFASINPQREFDTDFSSATIQDQQKRVDELSAELNLIKDRERVLTRQLRWLDEIAKGGMSGDASDAPKPDFDIASADKALKFLFSRGTDITQAIRAERNLAETVQQKLKAEKQKLEDLKKGAKKETYSIQIQANFSKSGKRVLELTYQTRNARWNPAYIIHAESESQQLRVEYYGEVSQNSGEDWQGVDFELSTGRPQFGGQPPELHPWTLDYFQDPRVLRSQRQKTFSAMDADMMEGAASSVMALSQVQEAGNALLYQISGKQSIPTGAQSKRVLIYQNTFDAGFIYHSVPKYQPHVYLSADWKNSSDYHLLPGNTWKYLDGDFIGSGHFQSSVPGEEITMGLGVDDSIKASRKLVLKEGATEGLFDSRERQRFIYEIELENFKQRKIQVKVEDQLPLSYQKDIEVIVKRLEPEPKERDKENKLTWELNLSAGEKKTLTLDFQVEYPEGKRITGL
ncbi:MAG: DUF4139 domain-containing protein [Candidatus Nitrohelix vancouverensis]|uniref:DUF4139 domain-containing protein n=1 Tax=Candidatus Nitrohelix vancouverensis TaxID=2705534 RepID=A0A7T0G456_9BACT|nr:MAG: DUF4139 domain-containing protein [Candidatus Nitrohelix vancouverensis]